MKNNPIRNHHLALAAILCFLFTAAPNASPAAKTTEPGEETGNRTISSPEHSRWNSLSEEEKQLVLKNFETWQRLTDDEKKQTYRNFEAFKKLPAETRDRIKRNYAQWKTMSPEKKEKLLKNYGKWKKLTPQQKKMVIKKYKSRGKKNNPGSSKR